MITLNKGLLIKNMDYEIKKNIIKRAISLYGKIDDDNGLVHLATNECLEYIDLYRTNSFGTLFVIHFINRW